MLYPTLPSAIQKDLRIWLRSVPLTVHEGERKKVAMWRKRMENLPYFEFLCLKNLPNYLTIEGLTLSPMPILPKLYRKLWGKSLERIFLEGTRPQDLATSTDRQINCIFNSDRFASDPSEVYLERSPQSPTASRTLLSSERAHEEKRTKRCA